MSASIPAAFARLHRSLQEALYRMRWTKLRPIQVEAIHEIFDGSGELIIAARTAAGKTEAAFLPILSRIIGVPAPGIRAIYAGPLKALINDQFGRLEQLCLEAETPVHKWHGDVTAMAKRRLLDQPSGLLLITPESIESLFVNHAHQLTGLFPHLEFVVIDELHSFIGTERGAHLRSLVRRLARKSRASIRVAGLSATLGTEIAAVCHWLRPGNPDAVCVIEDPEKKSIQLRVLGYLVSPGSETDEAEDEESVSTSEMGTDIFEAFHGKAALIFANNKRKVEELADCASREAIRRGAPNTFRVHHGSLSKEEREETEEALKSTTAVATFCSSSLEMGIDVGNVKLVGQVGPPWSVSSLAQRLGRSGRKEGEPSVILMFIEEEQPDQNTPLIARLFPRLLQAVATTELLVEKWCEPPVVDSLNLSTLVQQVLSVIAEQGGVRADELYSTLVADGGFPNVDQQTFVETLRSMGQADLIEQTPEGLLIAGLRGERIVRSHDFYVAFTVREEYRVNHGAHHIGNVPLSPAAQATGYLILAGRRWKILDIDHDRKTVTVEPSPAGRAPSYPGDDGEIHPRIRETMRALLNRSDIPPYLDSTAQHMLTLARAMARDAGLPQRRFFQDGPDTLWFTWTGTRIQRTLIGLGAFCGGLRVEDREIALVFEKTKVADVQHLYRGFIGSCPDAVTLARKFPARTREKYESYLSDDLTARLFAKERLDLEGALTLVKDLCS